MPFDIENFRLSDEITEERRRDRRISWKIIDKMCSSIKAALKKRGFKKNGLSTWNDILPYTPNDFRFRMESQFKPGMTWENHGWGKGKWHFDHIIPDSWFDYQTVHEESFDKSWALENFQPLWHEENISKGNSYSGDFCPDPPVLGGHYTKSPRSAGFVIDSTA
jgi:hypothetical protein